MRILAWIVFLAAVAGAAFFGSDAKYKYRPGSLGRELRLEGEAMDRVADALRAWRKEHGRYPTNDEGLLAVGDAAEDVSADFWEPYHLALTDRLCRSRSGLLSPWGVPFLYENRSGLDTAAIARSSLGEDPDPDWARRVDAGIYVWSVGARQTARDLKLLRWEMGLVWFGGVAAVVAAIIFLRWAYRRLAPDRTGWRVGATISILVALPVAASLQPTCYMSMTFRLWRRPELAAEVEAILGKYRDAGILRQETWRDLVNALHEENEAIGRAENGR